MSLYFKSVRWQNLLSTGNQWTEIKLNKFPTNLVIGENGAGKSTMLDAILFALYGRPYRNINKPRIVNSITGKNCLVEIEFRAKDKEYFIRRGIKPAIFEIYCDDVLIDQHADAREYQDYLEKHILQMTYKSFTQIVVIGSANFTPFMQLATNVRREVIEDLLDIQIFSKMLIILRDKMIKNKDDIVECKYQSDLLTQRIELIKKHMNDLRSLKKSNRSSKQEKIKLLQRDIASITITSKDLQERVTANLSKMDNKSVFEKRKKSLEKFGVEIESKIKRADKQITFFKDHNECPTCFQDIDEHFKQEFIDTRSAKKNEYESAILQLEEVYKDTEEEIEAINKVQKEIDLLEKDIYRYHTSIQSMLEQIADLQKELDEDDPKIVGSGDDQEQLMDAKKKLKEYSEQLEKMLIDRETYNIASSILKDGGIKTQIIKQYIPIINKLMNKYLSQLEFFVQFELDENFDEAIKSRFRDDFKYDSFSEGEKARLDLALLFTWRAISKIRSSTSTNLLIMDEVFDGSLDDDGTGYLLSILSDMNEDTNVFVISHKGHNLFDKFENVLEFKKVKNFSQLTSRGV